MSRIDEHEAKETLRILEEIGSVSRTEFDQFKTTLGMKTREREMAKSRRKISRALSIRSCTRTTARPGELMEELRFSLLEKARESVEVKIEFFEENKDDDPRGVAR